MTDTTRTAAEVADKFRCSTRKVTDTASKYGIGANLGGRAGYRFTEADELALWEAMKPSRPEPSMRRRRKRAA